MFNDPVVTAPSPVIAVCMPIADQVSAATMRSIMALDLPKPYHLLDRTGVPVEHARNHIVGRVLFDPALADVTHLLWVDDDMTFAPDALRRLLAHGLPIVGGLCHGRRAPHYAPILAYRRAGDLAGYAFRHDYPLGLVEVDATGGAFILVERCVYEAIEARFDKPGEGPYSNQGFGEDFSFCARAAECGFKTFVDTTLEIGHLAEVVVDSKFAKRNRLAEFNPWHAPAPAALAEGKPVASIIIPTFNQAPEVLRAAVESALHQTVPVEVIVIDNGSDEGKGVLAICDELGSDNPRLRLARIDENPGHPWDAINLGIQMMTTDHFCWLSSDDLLMPDKVERQLRFMADTGASASFHGYHVQTREGLSPVAVVPYQWRSDAEQRHVLSGGCAINGLTVMLHHRVFDTVGHFDPRFPITADWEFWNRVGRAFRWHAMPDILATRREFDNASERYATDPEMRTKWIAENDMIRLKYAPRCPSCHEVLP